MNPDCAAVTFVQTCRQTNSSGSVKNQISQLWHSMHSTRPLRLSAKATRPGPVWVFSYQARAESRFFFFFLWHKAEHWKNKRTVGDGDVQIALPGQLPRLVYGVLRCKNQRQASCLQPILTHDTDCDLLKTTVEKSTAVPCRAHTGCLPSAEVLLCHWKCGFNHR